MFDAAVTPLGARHAHEELEDTPVIDKGFLVLAGNNEIILDCLRTGELEKLRHVVAWLLSAAKGYGIKAVNPGGVEAWKASGGNVAGLDDVVPGFAVTPRQILVVLAQTVADLGLPHPLHVHANNLGLGGNWVTTLETMKALEDRPAHMAHIQFHSYGGEPGAVPTSRVADLVDYVNAHANLSVDVGQVMFGDTTSMTADGPLGHHLHRATHRKWFNRDVEMESGCGIVPIRYRQRSQFHATQWAIGLEWFLSMSDPWRIALTTDHPNGGSFLGYPEIIRLLMDREYRKEACRGVNQTALARSRLPELDREYTLAEIAVITRAGPARLLGLADRGHLGPGAHADVVLYDDTGPPGATFASPRVVIKSGEVIVEDGEIRRDTRGQTLYVEAPWEEAILPAIEHKLMELGFDLTKIRSGAGLCPIAPVAKNDLRGIGWTNDCILYGARSYLTVRATDQEIDAVAERLPASSSADYGTPFYDIFNRYERQFYKIDKMLFSPAEVTINNLLTGRVIRRGHVNPDVLQASLGLA